MRASQLAPTPSLLYTPPMTPTAPANPLLMPPDPERLLAELAAEGQPQGGVYERMKARAVAEAQEGRGGKPTLLKVRYSHADCADRILASPGIAQQDLAMIYGVTDAWMSIVINSDAFQAHLAARKEELIDPVLSATLNERYGALAARSVEVLLEKLHKPVDQISDKLALEAASLGARAMGVGEERRPIGAATASDHLAAIAHRLIDLNRPSAVIEGEDSPNRLGDIYEDLESQTLGPDHAEGWGRSWPEAAHRVLPRRATAATRLRGHRPGHTRSDQGDIPMSYSLSTAQPTKAAAVADLMRQFDAQVLTAFPVHSLDRGAVQANLNAALGVLASDDSQVINATVSGTISTNGGVITNVGISASVWLSPAPASVAASLAALKGA